MTNGEYGLTGLWPGTYTVTETVDPGCFGTTPTTYTVTVLSRQELVSYDGQVDLPPGDPRRPPRRGRLAPTLIFGNAVRGSIHGYRFEDLDGDGVDDAEPRLAGVTITLAGDVDGDGTGDTVTTTADALGEYGFTGPWLGVYAATETVPARWTATTPTSYTVTVLSQQQLVAELGLIIPAPPELEVIVGPTLAFGNSHRVSAARAGVAEATTLVTDWRLSTETRSSGM